MNVFDLRQKLTGDYADYVRSFLNIRDETIRTKVDAALDSGALWPDPLIQLNPYFASGGTVSEHVASGLLHSECDRIFCVKGERPGASQPLRLYRHQLEAIQAARAGANYVLTTGTGSGKSLSYIIPIVDQVLREGSGKGIRAIVVYPMNALANSQMQELHKFINRDYPNQNGPVRFGRYTGQETQEQRLALRATPPDILLTNYVMLELLLTRVFDRTLIRHATDLRFLVLDELHTYRGRQGADVALLIRRVRNACAAHRLQCVGTSATMATAGSRTAQREAVANTATRLFGALVESDRVIGETLQRVTPDVDFAQAPNRAQLQRTIQSEAVDAPKDHAAFVNYPLASWIETTLGLAWSEGELVRATPLRISGTNGAAQRLAQAADLPDVEQCARAIQNCLLAGYECLRADGRPTFAFRVHQFISRGESVFASLDPPPTRHVTIRGQQFVPGDRARRLFPIVFCRECGHEYYVVERDSGSGVYYRSRELMARPAADEEAGFLFASDECPWPDEGDPVLFDRVPADWVEMAPNGDPRIRSDRRQSLPKSVSVGLDGVEAANGRPMQFVPAPFRFCLACTVAYAEKQSDIAKLGTLGTGGRSTATTTLCLSVIRWLRESGTLPANARKVLSFTDNRQDASLQAGHFNDFVEIGLLRSALFRAMAEAGPEGLDHAELTQRVFDVLALRPEQYSVNPAERFQRQRTENALRDVLGYRLYLDLERGWRVTSPNLEQCGLLRVRYESVDDIIADEELWKDRHPALVGATVDQRREVCVALLDHFRRELAIKVDYLEQTAQERIQRNSTQHLIPPWALDDYERMRTAPAIVLGGRQGDSPYWRYLSGRSRFGQYLRRRSTFPNYARPKRGLLEDTEAILGDLVSVLGDVIVRTSDGERPGFQLQASAMRWTAGSGDRSYVDPTRIISPSSDGGRTNPFFVTYYREHGLLNRDLRASEHTAAVSNEDRERREGDFRDARLQLLFCSPTMELGVDIAQLNAVNLRNVPPTPANYAQRSGRAGRSGQPALVFTYCTTGSPHDQFFFGRQEDMVCGAVSPPRIELANEDLVRAHVQAVWLAETEASLEQSLAELLDLDGPEPSLQLRSEKRNDLGRPAAVSGARHRLMQILGGAADLGQAAWWSEDWLDKTLDQVMVEFDIACDRWRSLYRAARDQLNKQHDIIMDHSRSSQDKKQAKRLYNEAEVQLQLLTDAKNVAQDDFYSYRYFASEGFLPGYSFPRLPLSAFIPGRRAGPGHDRYVSRPRFLAISEFGPRALIYHEGARYRVNRVLLAASDKGDEGLTTVTAKQCDQCGYLHTGDSAVADDLCRRCESPLGPSMTSLFRLRNVATRREHRITSDEEERQRQGFELRTGVRFVERGGRPAYVSADVVGDAERVARMEYGDTATVWRMNLGWKRRKHKHLTGFLLDVERGYWASDSTDDDDSGDPMSLSKQTVIPFVEDTRNALLFQPEGQRAVSFMATLQAALKNAIQVVYQLEDNELAVEALPADEDRRLLLIYEAAEGGAGVLRRLVEEPSAIAQVARQALQMLHYDPQSGEDLSTGGDRCESACYDCLMGYWNQRDHQLLDRSLVSDYLMELARGKLEASSTAESREALYRRLDNLCDSELERRFLRFLFDGHYRLPSDAQRLFRDCGTRPDFVYDAERTVLYVDGPPHDNPQRAARDQAQQSRLEDAGWCVLRLAGGEWATFVGAHSRLFGNPQ